MAIVYEPSELVASMAPKKLVQKLVTQDLTLNRSVLKMLANMGILGKGKLAEIALRVIRTYKNSFKEERASGASKSVALEEALNGKRLMVQRVQDSIVFEVAKDIKANYAGEFYEWLPSDAEEPDPLHQLKYGKVFQIGKGEMLGERYGCKCGMWILVEETKLEI